MAKSKYDPNTFPLLAQDYARRGLIDKQIAAKLGIAEVTFYEYQKLYPKFKKAIKEGKKPVDIEVENSLLKRARGFSYTEIHREFKPGEKEDSKPVLLLTKKTIKVIPPETTACIIWLKNRRPKIWKDRKEIDIPGLDKIAILSKIPRPKKKKGNDAGKKNH